MRALQPTRLLLGVVVLSVLVAGLIAVVVTRSDRPMAGEVASTPLAARATRITPASFLRTYLDHGRVVRRDQGGDTVSEGQAYAMLIALGVSNRRAFDSIWSWTHGHLARPDGLLSWRWQDGKIADASSATDGDLDAARALVQAGSVFRDPAYTRAGVALGKAILDHETVQTPFGRVLVAGQWATRAPYWFNPSYVSPVATRVLAKASGDPRWRQLDRGSAAAIDALTRGDRLPPDWAQIDDQGHITPVPSPSGQPVEYGYDAARTVLRHAESCSTADRRVAEQTTAIVAHDGKPPVATYDLAGSPQTNVTSPLVTVSQAAGFAVDGRRRQALAEIRRAGVQQQQSPTYYGDAWTVLGPMLLTDPALGGCPVLEHS